MKAIFSLPLILCLALLVSCGSGGEHSEGGDAEVNELKEVTLDSKSEHDLTLYGAPYHLVVENAEGYSQLKLENDSALVFDVRVDIDSIHEILQDELKDERLLSKKTFKDDHTFFGLEYATHRGNHLLLEAPVRQDPTNKMLYLRIQVDYLKKIGRVRVGGVSEQPVKRG